MNTRKLIVAWAPVAVWMGVIFAVSSRSSLPRLSDPIADTFLKKGGHIAEYAILAGLCRRAIHQTANTRYPTILAFAVTVLYAISDEWHQSFVPGRNSQSTDALIDASGALISLAALYLWGRNKSGADGAQNPAPDVATSPASRRDPEVT